MRCGSESEETNEVRSQNISVDASEETSLLSSLLDDMQTVPQVQGEEVSDRLSKLYMEIENFNVVYGRLPLKSDIKKFVHEMKFKSPHMSELAQVVLATPATQVSVERSFSALSFILNEKRTSLSPENINSILLVKLNS